VDPTLSDADADRVFSVYLAAYEAGWELFPDVLTCLEQLSDCRLGVITNGQSCQQRLKLARTGIDDRFDCVVTSEQFGKPKPHPEIFRHACALLEADPRQAIFVGDSYDVDAVAARQAGLVGIWLDRTGAGLITCSPPMIHSLAELRTVIDSLYRRGA